MKGSTLLVSVRVTIGKGERPSVVISYRGGTTRTRVCTGVSGRVVSRNLSETLL